MNHEIETDDAGQCERCGGTFEIADMVDGSDGELEYLCKECVKAMEEQAMQTAIEAKCHQCHARPSECDDADCSLWDFKPAAK